MIGPTESYMCSTIVKFLHSVQFDIKDTHIKYCYQVATTSPRHLFNDVNDTITQRCWNATWEQIRWGLSLTQYMSALLFSLQDIDEDIDTKLAYEIRFSAKRIITRITRGKEHT